jgi:putative transposase
VERFIRSDALLDDFGEKFRAPPEMVYEYIIATVDVAQQKLRIAINEVR